MLLNTMLLLSGGDFFSRWLEGWNLGGLILVLIGAALIIIEMLIPGFGIAGISGAAAVIAGLIIGSNDPISALFSVAILVVILSIAAVIIFKVVFGKRKTAKNSRIVLNESIAAEATDRVTAESAELIGKQGIALTALRLSGVLHLSTENVTMCLPTVNSLQKMNRLLFVPLKVCASAFDARTKRNDSSSLTPERSFIHTQ